MQRSKTWQGTGYIAHVDGETNSLSRGLESGGGSKLRLNSNDGAKPEEPCTRGSDFQGG